MAWLHWSPRSYNSSADLPQSKPEIWNRPGYVPGSCHAMGGILTTIDIRRQTRAEAGLAAPRGTPSSVSPTEVVGFTTHHTSGPATQTPAQIQDYHFSINWADTGYARTVSDHGSYAVITEGRGYGVELAHALGHNRSHIGVAVIGTYESALPSVHALAAVRLCWEEAEEWAGRSLTRTGHRDLVATGCPGEALYPWSIGDMAIDGIAAEGDEELYGLSEGDTGPRVEGLQTSLRHSGFADLLGPYGPREDGVDGEYGPATTEAVLAARHFVDSGADSGATVTAIAAAQIRRAVARREAERAVAALEG